MKTSAEVRERQLVIVVLDLARFTHSVANLGLVEIATLVDAFDRVAGEVIRHHGGRVREFVGDGCLAVFEPDDVLAGPRCRGRCPCQRERDRPPSTTSTSRSARGLVDRGRRRAGRSSLVRGRWMGVIHAVPHGWEGPVRVVSEPVYRRLPSDRRSSWRKHQPPATYSSQI